MEKYVKLDDVESRIIASDKLVNPFDNAVLYVALSDILSGLLQSINDLPTKELDDFTEGMWERESHSPYMSRCSECGQFGDEEWSYCPRCGSKMKKKSKEIKYVAQQGVTGTINRNGTSLSVEMLEKAFYNSSEVLKGFSISDYKEYKNENDN